MVDLVEAIGAHDFAAALERMDEAVDRDRRRQGIVGDEALSLDLNSRGWINTQLGRYAEAKADITEARRSNPDLNQHNLKLVRLLDAHYESVFRPEMDRLRGGWSVEPCRRIAMAYFTEGFYAQAAGYFQLALSVAADGELAALYNDLSGAYLGSGLFIEAFQASAKALALDPNVDKTNHTIATEEFHRIGQSTDPFSVAPTSPRPAKKGRAKAGEAGVAPPAKADAAAQLRQLDQAVSAEQAKPAPEGNPGLTAALGQRAKFRLDAGDFDAAVSDLVELRRTDIDVGHDGLRLARHFSSHFSTVLKPLFDRLTAEKSSENYNLLGLAFFKSGFYINAATYFHLAASLSEGLVRAEALNNLAGAYLNSQHPVEALRASAQAIALNPQISKANHDLARMPLKQMQVDIDGLKKDRFSALPTSH